MNAQVLVVDPNPNNRLVLQRAFDAAKISAHLVDSAEALFKALPRVKPRVVVVEFDLVGQSGVRVLKQLAQLDGDRFGRILMGAMPRQTLVHLADAAQAQVAFSSLEGLSGVVRAVDHLLKHLAASTVED